MVKIESGFPGERLIVLSQPFLDLMRDNPLTGDLYIHSLGHIAFARHHHVSRNEHEAENYVFLYCTWGMGSVTIGEHTHRLSTNQFIVLPAGVAHCYGADRDDPWTIYWIAFGGVKASLFAREMNLPRDASPTVYVRQEQRTELFESMYSVLCGAFTIEKLNYANILLSHFLIGFLYTDFGSAPTSSSQYSESMIGRVTHFLSDNMERSLTLKEIASYAGYSESYFYRKFIKEMGYAPIDYFIRMKINKASVYLIKTNLSVSQISAKLGFRSPDYFSRTFKRIVGITATEFKKQGFKL